MLYNIKFKKRRYSLRIIFYNEIKLLLCEIGRVEKIRCQIETNKENKIIAVLVAMNSCVILEKFQNIISFWN